MKILVIGANGNIGGVAVAALEERGHEVLRVSRSTSPSVDLSNPESIRALFEDIGLVDGVVVASGSTPFKPLEDLEREDYVTGLMSKALAQIDVVRIGFEFIADHGSITLTSGVLSREPIAKAAAAAAANGAVESFVMAASVDTPRGIRLNVVSPDVLANSPHYHSLFPGHRPVTDDEVGRAYILAVEGAVNGHSIKV